MIRESGNFRGLWRKRDKSKADVHPVKTIHPRVKCVHVMGELSKTGVARREIAPVKQSFQPSRWKMFAEPRWNPTCSRLLTLLGKPTQRRLDCASATFPRVLRCGLSEIAHRAAKFRGKTMKIAPSEMFRLFKREWCELPEYGKAERLGPLFRRRILLRSRQLPPRSVRYCELLVIFVFPRLDFFQFFLV